MVLFLGKWLTLAFVLESLMITYVPAELLGQWLGSGSNWAAPLSAAIGVPAYLNGFVAVPVVAGLIENGMAPAAALSFTRPPSRCFRWSRSPYSSGMSCWH
jgi:uncharacterized membrane protein YraQ (UPF0718 family)